MGNGSNACGWYRTEITGDRDGPARLEFTDASDRLTLFMNGARISSSAVPPEGEL